MVNEKNVKVVSSLRKTLHQFPLVDTSVLQPPDSAVQEAT